MLLIIMGYYKSIDYMVCVCYIQRIMGLERNTIWDEHNRSNYLNSRFLDFVLDMHFGHL